jgi:hypothetical protein
MSDFSLIVWSNDEQETEHFCIRSLVHPWQRGGHDVEAVLVHPSGRARNIGEAYNGAMSLAHHPIKIYAHQDLVVEDRDFLTKLEAMFREDPRIGLVGIVGATIDTGGAFFHAPTRCKRGEVPQNYVSIDTPASFFPRVHEINAGWGTRFNPQRAQVKVVDCLLFASNMDLPFATCYRKTHMVAEDYCMRVREAGRTVWTIDSLVKHFSAGTVDMTYWESVRVFRRKWKHMLPEGIPSVETLMRFYNDRTRTNPEWDAVWAELEIKEETAA